MKHLIVTRFAVPRHEPDSLDLYRDEAWLEGRFGLFRRYFVPSVEQAGVPALLLCGSEVAELVASKVADLPWARVEVQDEWKGGWQGEAEEVLTRLDSDDAVHPGWFEAVERAPAEARICITKDSLRWDPEGRRLHEYHRREPAPLAAFRGGANPYAVDHKHLERQEGVHRIAGPYLLQVVHGGNLANRRPRFWRLDRRRSPSRLADFGVPSR